MPRSIVFFFLLVSFGILFVGCAAPEPDKSFEEFSFTDTDLERVQEALASSEPTILSLSGAAMDARSSAPASQSSTTPLDLIQGPPADPEKVALYERLRQAVGDSSKNLYRVNNPFLNVRSGMNVSSDLIERLEQGDSVEVLDIPSAQWAKARLPSGREGYVAFRYIAKLVTEQKLAEEKKKFEGKYYVDYDFLNIRKDPTTQAEKIGELLGQAIVTPLSINGPWARVSFEGREGYVSSQYLKPFQPAFLVRQEEYSVPILQYKASDAGSMAALAKHVKALKDSGKRIVTLQELYDLILEQEGRDVRWKPEMVVLTVAGVTAKNVREVSDALQASAVGATLFIATKDVGLTGITERMILNLLANGNDLQSEGHTGDDLRSLTDSQLALELSQSKRMIEGIAKKEVTAVSYPAGGVNDRVMKAAADSGYLFGMSSIPDKKFTRSQFLRLPSLFVSSSMTAEEVLALVK